MCEKTEGKEERNTSAGVGEDERLTETCQPRGRRTPEDVFSDDAASSDARGPIIRSVLEQIFPYITPSHDNSQVVGSGADAPTSIDVRSRSLHLHEKLELLRKALLAPKPHQDKEREKEIGGK